MQNPAEELNYLGEIIDHYVTEEKVENQGPFQFLGEDMVIRALSGTATGRASVTGLKTYLAKEVLKINDGGSYVTYRDILGNLCGEARKKYKMDSGELEMCFDWEQNRESIAKESTSFWMKTEELPEILSEEKIPWILLRLLQENAEEHLLKIWKLQEIYIDSADPERTEKMLREEYMKALHAMALQEIFYKELLVLPAGRNLETLARRTGEVRNIADTLEKYAEAVCRETGNDRMAEEIRRLAGKARKIEKELREAVKDVRSRTEVQVRGRTQPGENGKPDDIRRLLQRQHLYMILGIEQNIELGVEFQILTMFEAMNLKIKGNRAGETLRDWLESDGKWIWEVFDSNHNRNGIYREMDAYACEMLVDYWDRQPGKGYLKLVEAVDIYFEQLHRKFEDRRNYDETAMKEAKETIVKSNRDHWKTRENRNGDRHEE